MSLKEFKDRKYDILNETDQLLVRDIDTGDLSDMTRVYLSDEIMFKIQCKNGKGWR